MCIRDSPLAVVSVTESGAGASKFAYGVADPAMCRCMITNGLCAIAVARALGPGADAGARRRLTGVTASASSSSSLKYMNPFPLARRAAAAVSGVVRCVFGHAGVCANGFPHLASAPTLTPGDGAREGRGSCI